MRTTEYFAITANSDTTEGRGHKFDTGVVFTNEADAIAFATSSRYKRWGVQGTVGSKYDVRKCTTHIFDRLEDFDANWDTVQKVEQREKALAKLTAEDRKALGL